MFNFDDNTKKFLKKVACVGGMALGLFIVYKTVGAEDKKKTQAKIDKEIQEKKEILNEQLSNDTITVDEFTEELNKTIDEAYLKYDKRVQFRVKMANAIVKFGLWANEHEKALKGVTTALSVVAGGLAIANGVHDLKKKSKLEKQVANIESLVWNKAYSYGHDDCLNETQAHLYQAMMDKNDPIFHIYNHEGVEMFKCKISEAA